MRAGDLPQAIAYVDGGCPLNPGHGAWAAVLKSRGRTREVCGGEAHPRTSVPRSWPQSQHLRR